MSKTMNAALGWAATMGAAVMLGGFAHWKQKKRDDDAYRERVVKPNLVDRREVWAACIDYHKKLRKDLADAKAKIQAGEEIVRVAVGLMGVRKMLEGELAPIDWEKEQVSDADAKEFVAWMQRRRVYPPAEVSNAVIAHWWQELMRLFVEWGVLLPEEIEVSRKPFMRLVGQEHTEAVLRAEVFKLKELCEVYAKQVESMEVANRRERDERAKLEEEIRMLREVAELPTSEELEAAFKKRQERQQGGEE